MFLRIIFAAAALMAVITGLVAQAQPSANAPVQRAAVTPQMRLRVRSFARESDPILNPVRWAQFSERVPEGSRVRKGDPVFRLDMQGTLGDIQSLENRLSETENETRQQEATMRKSLGELQDKRAGLADSRDIQLARLAYLKSLPLAEEVQIAEGRLAVASQRLKAEEETAALARRRLERELVSPVMVEEAELALQMQQARTRYAEEMLRLARTAAHPDEMKIVQLRIRNLEIELEKMDAEIPIQERILQIETESRQRRLEALRTDLAERRQELESEVLVAPADGVLLYSPQLKRELTTGGKASKGMQLAEIPRVESLALQGVAPEQQRHLFRTGDPAEIHLNVFPGRKLTGTLQFIAPFSRDAREGEETASGVKVVEVVIEMDEVPPDLPLGVYGWAVISAQQPIEGPAVPVSWLRYRGGKAHVSVLGRLQPVNGVTSGESFLLQPPHPALEDLRPEGEWSDPEQPQLPVSGKQYQAGGELIPLESVEVEGPAVQVWDMKISWLGPENQFVQKGEPLVRLDSEQIRGELQNRDSDYQRDRGERESAEEDLAIQMSERDFQVLSAQLQLEIAELERDLVQKGVSASAVYQARMNRETARLDHQRAERDLRRAERNPAFTSPAERKRKERDLRRRELQLEQAEIQLRLEEEGATPLERSLAELEVMRKTANAAQLSARHHQNISRAQTRLRWRISRERRSLDRLTQVRTGVASMEIAAPVSGLVKYQSVWDGVRHSKVKSGMRVWRGTRLLSLSDTQQVFVEVDVPERLVQHLRPDLEVEVRIPSEGNLQWRGRVTRFGEILEPSAQRAQASSMYANQETPQEQVLRVRVVVESGSEEQLKPGAVAQVIFPFEK